MLDEKTKSKEKNWSPRKEAAVIPKRLLRKQLKIQNMIQTTYKR